MNKNVIQTAFKKLLGKGRAFLFPKGFTADFYDVLMESFEDLKNRVIALKYVHFPTKYVNKNDITNGEELFGLKDVEGTDEERAANVEGQWSIFAGTQNCKQIENVLQKKGLPVRVIENIPLNALSLYGKRVIGNGRINTPNGKVDPIVINKGENTFILQADDFMTVEQINILIETVIKNKPAQNGVYFLPRFLRKKEIHKKMTKNEMQTYKKSQYCDVRTKGGF